MTILLDTEKVAIKKQSQDYDCNPPRCRTCVYYSRGTAKQNRELKRTGKYEIEKCTFGNFKIVYFAICAEWRSCKGETLEKYEKDGE